MSALDAYSTAAVLGLLDPCSAEFWGFVELELSDCMSAPIRIKGLACMPLEDDGAPYVAQVFIQGRWIETTMVFRASLCDEWNAAAGVSLSQQMREDVQHQLLELAGVA
jgi:hypothetical protein